jgi:lipoprotein-anchoring transpeptidase ErfK/SrfK
MKTVTKVAAGIVFWIACVTGAAAGGDVKIDKSTQRMSVSVDGVTRYVWSVSTGVDGYNTPSGNFRPFRMEQDHRSDEWDNAPMPFSIFFTEQGHAIHGSYQTRSLGRPASHGCVRLAPQHAAKLYELVVRTGLGNTSVSITGSLPSERFAGDIVEARTVY